MDNEEKVTQNPKGGSKWLLLGIVIVLLIVAVVWFFVMKKDDSTTETTETEKTTEEVSKHPDWSEFTAKKYNFTISHPADYTVIESAVGNLIFSQAGAEIVDMYVVSASGSDSDTVMKNQEDLFMDTARGLMTADEAIQIKTAGVTGTLVNGVFGKNGGINLSHDGVAGAAIFFIQDEKLFVFDSYDKADTATRQIFKDMVDSIKF